VLLLVGGLRVADAAFRSITALEDEFRVITPTYPPLTTMAELGDGLAGVLSAEGIAGAHVLAGSFGGMVAQCFVRQHPHRVDRLALSTTAALDSESAAPYRQQAEMLAALPAEVVRAGAKDRFLDMVAPPDDERAFWTAYIEELFDHRLDKEDILSTLACILDFATHYQPTPHDLSDWRGQLLILDSDDDRTFGEAARQALRARYPRAKTYTFTVRPFAGDDPA
jgi:pimeloyl-ACP methyl ester carboxylesterase